MRITTVVKKIPDESSTSRKVGEACLEIMTYSSLSLSEASFAGCRTPLVWATWAPKKAGGTVERLAIGQRRSYRTRPAV